MNEKLLQTRLNSIRHYELEIKKLEDALKITRSTSSDLEKSLVEFCPFKPGDILIGINGQILKIVSINRSSVNNNYIPLFEFKILQEYKNNKWSYDSYLSISYSEIKEWKIIGFETF